MNHMVEHEWIEQKLVQLENDRCQNEWDDTRERQLSYLRNLYKTGEFSRYSAEGINRQLVLIFHGYEY